MDNILFSYKMPSVMINDYRQTDEQYMRCEEIFRHDTIRPTSMENN